MIPQMIYISVVRQVGEFIDDTHNYNIIEGGKYIQYYSMVRKTQRFGEERVGDERERNNSISTNMR